MEKTTTDQLKGFKQIQSLPIFQNREFTTAKESLTKNNIKNREKTSIFAN